MIQRLQNKRLQFRRYIIRSCMLAVIISIPLLSFAQADAVYALVNNPAEDLRQEEKIKPLSEILKEVEKHYGIKFALNDKIIDNKYFDKTKVPFDNLESTLKALLGPLDLKYVKVDNYYVVQPSNRKKEIRRVEKRQSSSETSLGSQQFEEVRRVDAFGTMLPQANVKDVEIRGRVTAMEDNSPLPGVNIIVKGTTIGTTSDVNGQYALSVPDANSIIVFSFIGYTTEEVVVNGRSVVDVSLIGDIQQLSEIVVVGYGEQKRSDVTGALVSVSSSDIKKMPVTNSIQALQGRAAGVDITSNERPGEIGKILIRGTRSINATNDPLYVVDGIPLSAGGIETINPNDIESIDILKDASATAIYGSRGANGVILVTTKKGKSGALSLNYDANVSIEKMYDRMDMMNSGQYIEFRRDAYRRINYLNPAATNGYPNDATYNDDQRIFGGDEHAWANVAKGWESGTWDGSRVPTTNWTDLVLKTGVTHQHTLSASGGTDKMKAYGSFGYLKQDGTQLGQDYERFTGNFSLELNPVDWFKMGGNITATYGDQNYGFATSNVTGPGNLYFAAQSMLPYAVPFETSGNRINLPGGDVNIQNPIGEDEYSINQRMTTRILGSFFAEVKILEGLKYRVNFGPDLRNWNNGRWMDARSINRGAGEPGSTNYAQYNTNSRRAWTLDNLVYYDKTFNDHKFNLTLLQTASAFHEESSSMTGINLPWDDQKWYQLNSVSALNSYGTNLIETSLTSYMARINYSFLEKYLLTASVRWDGASQLAEGYKWDMFPSLALAWRLDQESFIQNKPWIDQLKLRLGVGTTGNSAIDPYKTKGRATTLYYTWGALVDDGYVSSDASLASPNEMPNIELGWERTTQLNLGIDFGFLKNRITGAIDVYTSKTTDLLFRRGVPSVIGYTFTYDNIGETANKGIDITLNTVNIQKPNFSWSTGLTFAASKDEIVELSNGKEDDINNNLFIGERVLVRYDYVKDRIWQNTEADLEEMDRFNSNGHNFRPGDIKPVDLNGDYRIDLNNDRAIRGHTNPDWTAGLTSTLTYKNWDLSLFIFSRWGLSLNTGAESLQGRFGQRVLDYWTIDNPTNEYPAPNYNSASGDPFRNSMNYQDGSFVKVRNISLGYLLPSAAAQKLRLQSLKIYTQVMNPGLIYSKVNWIDPDLGGSTFNRSLIFGVNVGI